MKTSPIKIISIVCPLYSGSTLLTLLLATHPDVGTLGEGQKFHSRVIAPRKSLPKDAAICSCGVEFTECSFWQAIKADVVPHVPQHLLSLSFTSYQFYQRWSLNTIARRVCFECALRNRTQQLPHPLAGRFKELCEANAVFIQAVLQHTGAAVYLDATKKLVNTTLINSCPQFKVYVIHLVRDARAQIASTLKWQPQVTIEIASQQWVKELTDEIEVLSNGSFRSIRVKYEQLCASPADTMAEIFHFCGLDPNQGSLEFRNFSQHIMGNFGTRFGGERQIRDRQEWRQRLTPDQLLVIDRIAGKLNSSLGYV